MAIIGNGTVHEEAVFIIMPEDELRDLEDGFPVKYETEHGDIQFRTSESERRADVRVNPKLSIPGEWGGDHVSSVERLRQGRIVSWKIDGLAIHVALPGWFRRVDD